MPADQKRRQPKVLAISSPKGGVGKTQTAVTLAHLASLEGYRVFLADADANRSAADWATRSGERVKFDVEDLREVGPRVLGRLRELRDYDLVVVDLPGAEESEAWRVLLNGSDGKPVFDAIVVPSGVRAMDLRPVARALAGPVSKSGVPYLLVGTLVKTPSVPQANTDLADLAASGISVARTIIRDLSVHADAVRENKPITDMPGGSHSTARAAEREYRSLAREVFGGLLGLQWSQPDSMTEPTKGNH
ncbi:Plasmid partitioning protein ParA [Pseudonocardia sp. Ae168_Ps1]|uniref:ParA family protein n=1 Tax=unclassified Pseudonocardia TaxID=2619320 RepID=UPI00095FDD64|nr:MULTISPECIES: ParA family protein [unclassified Pseudonocardia]OLL74358.1 Plasmid partitioning protein ParA [Pseudonocardia sp. Ae150A_Ps1]OLL80338.1 Plasmid partitioning protein ParA [Pseudonocardia sp. Ae168_Ps1]OLL85535.1 Plasmid partitioning protein ParA [Pseudonocardia sp. Ae263_Ps1]OLL94438.1 Plasmid partitioning protein ParA [Pseudonocardia sp. Ae356_Ps1]